MNKEIRHELNIISEELRKAGDRIGSQKDLEDKLTSRSQDAVDALQAAESKLSDVLSLLQIALEQDGDGVPKPPRKSRKKEPESGDAQSP